MKLNIYSIFTLKTVSQNLLGLSFFRRSVLWYCPSFESIKYELHNPHCLLWITGSFKTHSRKWLKEEHLEKNLNSSLFWGQCRDFQRSCDCPLFSPQICLTHWCHSVWLTENLPAPNCFPDRVSAPTLVETNWISEITPLVWLHLNKPSSCKTELYGTEC